MIKAITGTKDILPDEIRSWYYLEEIVRRTMERFNYKELRTPVFEETALFARGIGEATDIVSKEMYTFLDRSDTSITLKPEMTASTVRALIEHSLHKQQQLNKLYYISPMFRQERPQAGRFRQFHQFGAEALGSTEPSLDAEMIILAYDVINSLGLKNNVVVINSLGIPEERENYKAKLREYLSGKLEQLSEESRKRYDTNILRIFDSKAENDQAIMKEAPLLYDHLGEETIKHFETVMNLLKAANVPYEIDKKLVRGLDYYTHTTFEILSGSVGSQSALCGGGRYDLLVQQLGGDAVPGVGFAAGIERILLACENEGVLNLPEEKLDLYIVRLDKEPEVITKAYDTALTFRRAELKVELDYLIRSVKAQMREANKLNAKYVIMFGGEEYQQGKLVLKEMETGEQTEYELDKLDEIANKIKGG